MRLFLQSLLCLLLAGLASPVFAQRSNFIVSGRVFDADTKEAISFATVGAPGTNIGTRTDDNGFFTLPSNIRLREIKVSCVGYKALAFPINADSARITLEIPLQPLNELLKEVIVKPKKYRNKNNPAVELINLVVENRERNRVENFTSFHEEQYEKVMMGISNLSQKTKDRKVFKQWKFAMENVDTTKMDGKGIIPAYLQENVQDFYSQNEPKRSKIRIKGTQKVVFPIIDQDGIDKYIRYLYQDIDIYDNYVVLLTDHFLSPIADKAPLFYRYYPADTTIEHGIKIVRLQFFPRNKTDMLLQGNLYIALDSTYPVTKIDFSLNPNINLNWVRSLNVEQTFNRMPSTGKWVLADEDLDLDFGITKRSVGMYGQRYISHRNQEMDMPLPDSLFDGYGQRITLTGADRSDNGYWQDARHVALTNVEAATYKNIDSLTQTRLFTRASKTVFILAMGHWKPTPGLEIGRINSFYSFNDVEGDRFKFGGRTNPDFNKKINLEGFGAYGLRDKQWKYGIGANISLAKGKAYNSFPYNMLRINYQQDLMVPGVIPNGTFAVTNLATSLVRGTNDRFFFQKKFIAQYEKEFLNRLSFMVGFEHKEIQPRGSLRFVPTDDIMPLDAAIVTAKPYVQVRFAPGEEFYQTKNGWRQRIRFNFIGVARYSRGISGFMGGQYKFDEVFVSAYKFSNLPPIGYNYWYMEAGGVFGKVPYPLMMLHRGNQSINYRFMSFSMMNFMEFVSDRYVALHMEQSFYGFFTNKIPLIKRLKLREFASVKAIYGQVTEQNQPREGSGLYKWPTYPDGTQLTYTLEGKPYVEASIGLGNIFKVFRVELVRRFTYLDHPQTRKYGIRLAGQMQF